MPGRKLLFSTELVSVQHWLWVSLMDMQIHGYLKVYTSIRLGLRSPLTVTHSDRIKPSHHHILIPHPHPLIVLTKSHFTKSLLLMSELGLCATCLVLSLLYWEVVRLSRGEPRRGFRLLSLCPGSTVLWDSCIFFSLCALDAVSQAACSASCSRHKHKATMSQTMDFELRNY